MDLKAAALLQSITLNHALVDGNKRLCWLPVTVFLDLNGLAPDVDDDQAFDLVMAVSQGDIDVPEIAIRLRIRDV